MAHKSSKTHKSKADKNDVWLPRLNPSSSNPLYEQLLESVALAVAAGELRPGSPLPSVRTLAAELRINPNTAARSLRAMERSGLAQPVRGVGSVGAEEASAAAADLARHALDRELHGAVEVARRLGLGLRDLRDALSRKWKEEAADADRS